MMPFAEKLVGDVLDRLDLQKDFDSRENYARTVTENELIAVERNAPAADNVDELDLEL